MKLTVTRAVAGLAAGLAQIDERHGDHGRRQVYSRLGLQQGEAVAGNGDADRPGAGQHLADIDVENIAHGRREQAAGNEAVAAIPDWLNSSVQSTVKRWSASITDA